MIAALACGEFGDMLALQRGLVHQFGMDAVSINVNNGNVLTVTFTNSQAATLPDPDRAAFACRVAEFVRDHYREYPSLARVNVGFARVSSVGLVTISHTDVPYSFTTADLGTPRDTTESANKRKAAA